jgi:hypothetical protein
MGFPQVYASWSRFSVLTPMNRGNEKICDIDKAMEVGFTVKKHAGRLISE